VPAPVRTLVVWCPDWPVVAAGIAPDVPAVAVRANRVVAATPAARAEGVRAGQRRREAQGRCPGVTVVEPDPGREARAFELVVTALEAFTPRIELTRPGVVGFCTRGPSRWAGGDAALARRVRDAVDAVLGERGWGGHVRVGVADGPFAATLAARAATSVTGALVVPPGGSGVFLAPMPVAVLGRWAPGPGEDLAGVLVRLGLTTLGAFAALDPGDVVGRFGAFGERAHRLARGLDPRPVATGPPPPQLRVTIELDPPAERVDAAAFAAKRLADELHDRLDRAGLACTRVAVVAETDHGERRERTWRHEGMLGAAAVAERVRWQLEGWLQGPPAVRPSAGISRLTLEPDEVVPAHGRQLGFWGGETAAAARAARAVARVQGLLGADAVAVPERRGGRGPAERVGLVPAGAIDLTAPRSPVPPDGAALAPWPGRIPPPAPATVHHEPVPAEVLDGEGTTVTVSGRGMVSAPPARLSVAGGPWAPVEAWAGPWPAEERWWDPHGHRRRARLQVLAGGHAHLLALEGGRWWVEATYD